MLNVQNESLAGELQTVSDRLAAVSDDKLMLVYSLVVFWICLLSRRAAF